MVDAILPVRQCIYSGWREYVWMSGGDDGGSARCRSDAEFVQGRVVTLCKGKTASGFVSWKGDPKLVTRPGQLSLAFGVLGWLIAAAFAVYCGADPSLDTPAAYFAEIVV